MHTARRLLLAIVLTFALIAVATAAEDRTAQSVLHVLDYMAVDYGKAVEHGRVKNADEYKEMLEFSSQVATLLGALPENAEKPRLVAQAQDFAKAVQQKADAADIARRSAELRQGIIVAYRPAVAPKSAPDITKGVKLFASLCVSCHGAEGRGDGPAASALNPAPANFHDRARMAQRSAFGLYNTITLGVQGTAMAGYSQLPDDERWALAFFVAALPNAPEQARGEALWKADQARHAFPTLAALTTLSSTEARERYGEDAAAVQAYLLAHPQALDTNKPSPVLYAIETLDQALAAYKKGERAAAQQLSINAYLEGFELAEGSLRSVDEKLMKDTEREMMAFRTLIAQGAPIAAAGAQHRVTVALLRQAEERLNGERLSAGAAYASALLILVREGLEAILVLAALIAFLVKTKRRDALPFVHAGWIAALVVGVMTWFVATYLVGISGAGRETTEGVTALAASAILIYVGFWLHSRAHAGRWQHFIKAQVDSALEQRTLWALAAVSFLAVYREVFELVLFYEALWAQAGADGGAPLLGGIATAFALLLLLGAVIFKYSVRLPIGPFFTATSVLMTFLAVVFAGQGIAALQKADTVPATAVDFVTVPALGIFPTAQSLATQAVLLALISFGFYFASRQGRKSPQ